VGDAVQAQEDRPAGRIAPARQRAALKDVNEQPSERFNRIVITTAWRWRRRRRKTTSAVSIRRYGSPEVTHTTSPLDAAHHENAPRASASVRGAAA
jgi:hypothetical protein